MRLSLAEDINLSLMGIRDLLVEVGEGAEEGGHNEQTVNESQGDDQDHGLDEDLEGNYSSYVVYLAHVGVNGEKRENEEDGGQPALQQRKGDCHQ